MRPSIEVHGLAKSYGQIAALRGVGLEVFQGEVFGVLGPNGAGKTTLLECIIGLRKPDSGSIVIAGVDSLRHAQESRRVVGAQLQSASLQDKISPRRALELFGSFYEKATEPGELLRRFGLMDKADSRFLTLSEGQRRRLFLALALVNDPAVVVFDEPTAGLDPKSKRELHAIVAGLRQSGRTVILSTHDLGEAETLCDRVGILVDGRMVAVGRPAELIAAAGAPTTIEFTMAKPAGPSLRELAAAGGGGTGPLYCLRAKRPGEALQSIARAAEADENEIVDLHIRRPSLEDAFLSVTGRNWPDSSQGAES